MCHKNNTRRVQRRVNNALNRRHLERVADALHVPAGKGAPHKRALEIARSRKDMANRMRPARLQDVLEQVALVGYDPTDDFDHLGMVERLEDWYAARMDAAWEAQEGTRTTQHDLCGVR